jgi:hypothetical protein
MMPSKHRNLLPGAAFLLLAAILLQCASWFGSATLRVTYYIEDDIYHLDNKVESAEVDLRENREWQEHHDNIKGISRILFAFWVKNPSVADATAQFYMSTDSSLATAQDIIHQATLVLDGIAVPAQDSVYITAAESYRYFRNVEELADRLIEGRFRLYCIAQEAPFEIEVPDSAAFVVDFTYAVDWEF